MAHLYAITGSMERARFFLNEGVPYLQLRFKEHPLSPHQAEISAWKHRFPKTRVILNDDLEQGLRLGVWGVHLGQQDLARYSRQSVREAPLAIGISTHSDREIETALDYGPALLGFGPIFPTSSKKVVNSPQGLARLRETVASTPLPIAAIGGIGEGNLTKVAETGVSMVAMISYLDRFRDPGQLSDLMAKLSRHSAEI